MSIVIAWIKLKLINSFTCCPWYRTLVRLAWDKVLADEFFILVLLANRRHIEIWLHSRLLSQNPILITILCQLSIDVRHLVLQALYFLVLFEYIVHDLRRSISFPQVRVVVCLIDHVVQTAEPCNYFLFRGVQGANVFAHLRKVIWQRPVTQILLIYYSSEHPLNSAFSPKLLFWIEHTLYKTNFMNFVTPNWTTYS